uniref:Cadherin domain-containing protein n=1 Tax=Glossina palpalis gambiensis TaxID=67801 RepID=A0A1B0BWI7_9MUSC
MILYHLKYAVRVTFFWLLYKLDTKRNHFKHNSNSSNNNNNNNNNKNESTPVGTTIFRNIQALDKDAGVNGLVEYFIVEGSTNTTEDEKMTIADGYGTFAISFPHQGQSANHLTKPR